MKKLLKLSGYLLWVVGILGVLSLLMTLFGKSYWTTIFLKFVGIEFIISVLMMVTAYFLTKKYGDERIF